MREIECGEVRELCDVLGDFRDVVVREKEPLHRLGPVAGRPHREVGQLVVGGIEMDLKEYQG